MTMKMVIYLPKTGLQTMCTIENLPQTTLFINEGPLGKGVFKELPKCVMCGYHESLPSHTLMGFKEKYKEGEQHLDVVMIQ
jgi:hypothetical protein